MEKPFNSLGVVNGDLILCPDLAFVNARSEYEINGDPVFIGPDKFLNGEKLARTHLSFTRDPRNLASFRTVNITAICNRICTVACKRVARVKNSTVQKFIRSRVNSGNTHKGFWLFTEVSLYICICGLSLLFCFVLLLICPTPRSPRVSKDPETGSAFQETAPEHLKSATFLTRLYKGSLLRAAENLARTFWMWSHTIKKFLCVNRFS